MEHGSENKGRQVRRLPTDQLSHNKDGEKRADLGGILEVKLPLISSRWNVFVKNREEFWIIPKFLGFINRERV